MPEIVVINGPPGVVAGEIHRLVAKGIAGVKRENVVAIGLKRGAVQRLFKDAHGDGGRIQETEDRACGNVP